MTAARAERIAVLNDRFRSRIGIPLYGASVVPGTFVITAGIAALAPELKFAICERVRNFDAFSEDDPHGERDFGAFDVRGVGKVSWKIDYYADASMESGTEDPADMAKSYRVLTIMLAEEY